MAWTDKRLKTRTNGRRERNIRLVQSAAETSDGLECWEVRIYDRAKGKTVSRSVRGGIREARKVRAEMQTLIASGELETRSGPRDVADGPAVIEQWKPIVTVGDLLSRWLVDVHQPAVGRTTFHRHSQIVKNHLIPRLGRLKLAEIGPLDVQRFYAWATTSGRMDGTGGLSPQTLLQYRRLLSQALEQAVEWEMLDRNPCRRVRTPSVRRPDMQILTGPQLAELLEFCRASKYFIPIQIGAATGMRRGEILALHWDQVDFGRSTITILYSLEEVVRELALKEPKNHSSRRTIEVDPGTMRILAEHRQRQERVWETIGAAPERRLVCADIDGVFMRPKNVSTGFKSLIMKSGLPRIRFHDLRHTHASLLLHAGVSIIQVSARIGHSNVSTTLNLYGHLVPHSGRESADAIARILAQGAEGLNPNAG